MPSGGTPPKGFVALVAVLLAIAIANNMTMFKNSSIRAVEVVSILATDALAGILAMLGISYLKRKKE